MMSAQKELDKKCMPNSIEDPRTNKQRLWNDIIKFLQERNCKWKSAEVQSFGSSFVQALTDTLWLIDGQHDVLRRQGYSIPSTFDDFDDYNRPELNKHRKRERGKMSTLVLKSLSSHYMPSGSVLEQGFLGSSQMITLRGVVKGFCLISHHLLQFVKFQPIFPFNFFRLIFCHQCLQDLKSYITIYSNYLILNLYLWNNFLQVMPKRSINTYKL